MVLRVRARVRVRVRARVRVIVTVRARVRLLLGAHQLQVGVSVRDLVRVQVELHRLDEHVVAQVAVLIDRAAPARLQDLVLDVARVVRRPEEDHRAQVLDAVAVREVHEQLEDVGHHHRDHHVDDHVSRAQRAHHPHLARRRVVVHCAALADARRRRYNELQGY